MSGSERAGRASTGRGPEMGVDGAARRYGWSNAGESGWWDGPVRPSAAERWLSSELSGDGWADGARSEHWAGEFDEDPYDFSERQWHTRQDLPESPEEILVVRTRECGAYSSLLSDAATADMVGFDAEWLPDQSEADDNPIAVLQLAFPVSRRTYILQLNVLETVPLEVTLLFLNPEVVKVGYAIDKDKQKLRLSGISSPAAALVDLQPICELWVANAQWEVRPPGSLGLVQAAYMLLGVDMMKDKSITCSDWNRDVLTQDQIYYAAMDAWVTLRLYSAVNMHGGYPRFGLPAGPNVVRQNGAPIFASHQWHRDGQQVVRRLPVAPAAAAQPADAGGEASADAGAGPKPSAAAAAPPKGSGEGPRAGAPPRAAGGPPGPAAAPAESEVPLPASILHLHRPVALAARADEGDGKAGTPADCGEAAAAAAPAPQAPRQALQAAPPVREALGSWASLFKDLGAHLVVMEGNGERLLDKPLFMAQVAASAILTFFMFQPATIALVLIPVHLLLVHGLRVADAFPGASKPLVSAYLCGCCIRWTASVTVMALSWHCHSDSCRTEL